MSRGTRYPHQQVTAGVDYPAKVAEVVRILLEAQADVLVEHGK